jgi:hypothetical protein
MGVDDPANHIQLSGVEAVATGQLDRFEPELARAVLSLDVHVRRLIAVEAGEENPVRPRNALDSWHSDILAPLRAHPSNSTPQTPLGARKRQSAERQRSAAGVAGPLKRFVRLRIIPRTSLAGAEGPS